MRGGGAGARVVSQCLRRRDGGENAGGYRPFRGSDADSAAQGGCGERVSFGVEALIEIWLGKVAQSDCCAIFYRGF